MLGWEQGGGKVGAECEHVALRFGVVSERIRAEDEWGDGVRGAAGVQGVCQHRVHLGSQRRHLPRLSAGADMQRDGRGGARFAWVDVGVEWEHLLADGVSIGVLHLFGGGGGFRRDGPEV